MTAEIRSCGFAVFADADDVEVDRLGKHRAAQLLRCGVHRAAGCRIGLAIVIFTVSSLTVTATFAARSLSFKTCSGMLYVPFAFVTFNSLSVSEAKLSNALAGMETLSPLKFSVTVSYFSNELFKVSALTLPSARLESIQSRWKENRLRLRSSHRRLRSCPDLSSSIRIDRRNPPR